MLLLYVSTVSQQTLNCLEIKRRAHLICIGTRIHCPASVQHTDTPSAHLRTSSVYLTGNWRSDHLLVSHAIQPMSAQRHHCRSPVSINLQAQNTLSETNILRGLLQAMSFALRPAKWFYNEFGLAAIHETGWNAYLIITARACRMFAHGANSLMLGIIFQEY